MRVGHWECEQRSDKTGVPGSLLKLVYLNSQTVSPNSKILLELQKNNKNVYKQTHYKVENCAEWSSVDQICH